MVGSVFSAAVRLILMSRCSDNWVRRSCRWPLSTTGHYRPVKVVIQFLKARRHLPPLNVRITASKLTSTASTRQKRATLLNTIEAINCPVYRWYEASIFVSQ